MPKAIRTGSPEVPDKPAVVRVLTLLGVDAASAAAFYDQQSAAGFEDFPERLTDFVGSDGYAFVFCFIHNDLGEELEGLQKTLAPLGVRLEIGDREAFWGESSDEIEVEAIVRGGPPTRGPVRMDIANGDWYAAMAALESIIGPEVRFFAFRHCYGTAPDTFAVLRAEQWDEVEQLLGPCFAAIFFHPGQPPRQGSGEQ
jgi:hypothetical protein